MGEDLVEIFVNAYANKYNIPVKEARKMLAPILSKKETVNEFTDFINKLGITADTLQKFPDEVKSIVTPIVLKDLIKGDDDTDLREVQRMANRIVLTKTLIENAFKPSGGGEPQIPKEIVERIVDLEDRFNKLIEYLKEKENKDKLAQQLEEMQKRLDELQNRLQGKSSAPESIELIDKFSEQIDKFTKALEKLGYKVERGYPLDKVIKDLEKMGYKVERAGNIDLAELEEKIRKKVEHERQIEQERIKLIGDIIKDIISEIFGPMIKGYTEAQKEVLKQRLAQSILQRMQSRVQQPKPKVEEKPRVEVKVEEAGKSGAGEVEEDRK